VRVLLVTPFYEPFWAYGGMARASSGLARALARRGHAVTIATVRLDAQAPASESLGGVGVHRFDSPALLTRFLVPWAPAVGEFLRGALRATDIVHVVGHRNGLAVSAASVATDARKPWVLQPSGTYPSHGQYGFLKALFDGLGGARVVQDAAALVALSDSEAKDLPRPAAVVPNGVEPCGTAPRPQPRARPRILFVGTDRPQKRGHLLPALLDALPGVELHLVGAMGESFRRRFHRHSERSTFSGVLGGEALAAAYAAADLLVHPAVGEAFGLVPFEAALAGTPAVVVGGHGCGEWYRRAGGCVVLPDDAPALLGAVRQRLDAPELREKEAGAVSALARERLTWEKAAMAMESVYHAVLDRRPS
jgi:glycosyltransferase involved in cell wall biosynthesis